MCSVEDTAFAQLALQLDDEVFYERGGRGWFRNTIGAGIGDDVNRSFSVDAYRMLQEFNFVEVQDRF